MGQSTAAIHQQRVRFEEVTPAHEYAAFFDASLESLVAHLDLPVFEGYDDLDDLRLAFFTLQSGETVTLGEYLNSPQPGTSLYVDSAMENIPQIVFDSCQQLQVSKQEIVWLHPNIQGNIDYSVYESVEKRRESSRQDHPYEPIDCFNYALQIYTRQDYPLYWAMLQHNLGLAYFNRNQGDRKENLERSIECFNRSLEIYTQNEFPEKWKINQDDLTESIKSLLRELVKQLEQQANIKLLELSTEKNIQPSTEQTKTTLPSESRFNPVDTVISKEPS